MNLREDLAGGERSCIWSAVAKAWWARWRNC